MAEMEEVQEGQEGAPPPQPEAPQQEAPQYDYDPDLVRSQYEEVKRREREVERREREWQQKLRESERQQRFPDPSMDMLDPVQRAVLDRLERMDRRIAEREEREEREREEQRTIERVAQDLDRSFRTEARRAGMPKEAVESQASQFYDLLTSVYPEPSMIRAIGPDQAVRNVFQWFKPSNGTQTVSRGPRASVVIPQGSAGAPSIPQVASNGRPMRGENETDEQWGLRLAQYFKERGTVGIGDGVRASSE